MDTLEKGQCQTDNCPKCGMKLARNRPLPH
jgi:hypothetical protein